ncbi:MAG: tetratricopeptide repeat protein [Gemmatimonadota bacterium]|nr:tetratricopeptide repeat protein [Gemmatimonadota bacterium]
MHRFRFLFFLPLFVACGAQEQSADLLFREGEQATHDMASYPVAEVKLAEFLTLFPDDPRAEVALQALARVLMNQQKHKEAIARYETLIARFPQSRYCVQAQFMIGYIHDQLGDYEQARVAYQQVIDTYPNSELVDDAKFSIENLGKVPDQWLRTKPINAIEE